MAAEPDVVAFAPDDPAALTQVIDQLSSAGHGGVNVYPGVDPAVLPGEREGWLAIFTNRGPGLPQATYVAVAPPGRATLGLRHGLGTTVTKHLTEEGVVTPDAWRKLNDHPKRGLVLSLPADIAPGAVAGWVVAALDAVVPAKPDRDWVLETYR